MAKSALEKALQKISELLRNQIKTRTRLGYGVDDNGTQSKLKPLAKSTIKSRESKRLSSETSPSTSNLTESGDMLDGMTARVSQYTNGTRIEIQLQAKDLKKAQYVSEDRPFMNLTSQQEQDTIDAIETASKKDLEAAIAKSIRDNKL